MKAIIHTKYGPPDVLELREMVKDPFDQLRISPRTIPVGDRTALEGSRYTNAHDGPAPLQIAQRVSTKSR